MIITVIGCAAFIAFIVVMTKLKNAMDKYPTDVTTTLKKFNDGIDVTNDKFKEIIEQNDQFWKNFKNKKI